MEFTHTHNLDLTNNFRKAAEYKIFGMVCDYMDVITALRGLRQEHHEFQVSWSYTVSACESEARGQRLMLCFPPSLLFVRQTLIDEQGPRYSCPFLLSTGITGMSPMPSFYMGVGDANSGPQVCKAST